MSNDAKPSGLGALLEVDRVVHEPARLAILTVLASAEEVQSKRYTLPARGLFGSKLSLPRIAPKSMR